MRSDFADDGSAGRRGLCHPRLIVARFQVRGKRYRAVTLWLCWHDGGVRHFDLCIIGTGSGNSIIDDRFDHLSVALVEMGTFGGTCLNVGCIPSKMFVHPADLAASTIQAARLGVDLDLQGVRWREIRDRIFGRIDPKAANGRAYRYRSQNVTVFDARGTLCRAAGAGRRHRGDN